MSETADPAQALRESSKPTRQYSGRELRAFRRVGRREWSRPGDPSERGPAQWAAGNHWPLALRSMANAMEAAAEDYRIAADALEREIAMDTRCEKASS